MKATFFAFFLCLIAALANAQTISGHVLRADGQDAEFATVVLLAAADSNLVKGAVSDGKGRFAFENIPPGAYLIRAELIGEGKPLVEVQADKTVLNVEGNVNGTGL
jgi:hypothetical protein